MVAPVTTPSPPLQPALQPSLNPSIRLASIRRHHHRAPAFAWPLCRRLNFQLSISYKFLVPCKDTAKSLLPFFPPSTGTVKLPPSSFTFSFTLSPLFCTLLWTLALGTKTGKKLRRGIEIAESDSLAHWQSVTASKLVSRHSFCLYCTAVAAAAKIRAN